MNLIRLSTIPKCQKPKKDFDPDMYADTYVNMELAIPRDGEGPEFARVTKRLRDANGLPIGVANNNPILDTRMYEVEYPDGHTASLAANVIALPKAIKLSRSSTGSSLYFAASSLKSRPSW